MNKRNEMISNLLTEGKLPVLKHEMGELKRRFDDQIAKQKDLAKKFREAMTQSSETWHDNAPADVIKDGSKILSESAESTIRDIERAVVFETVEDCSEITLGSVFDLKYEGDSEIIKCVLTGTIYELSENIRSKAGDKLEIVTIGSPIGKSLLGRKEGETISYSIRKGERKLNVDILKIR